MILDTPTPDELNFVFDSWANSYRKSPFAGCVPNHLWEQVSRECMRTIMERGAEVIVAATPIEGRETERRVMGYSVSEPRRGILHFVYVKKDYRGLGVGTQLLAATRELGPVGVWTYTHRTHSSQRFLGPAFRWDDTSARIK